MSKASGHEPAVVSRRRFLGAAGAAGAALASVAAQGSGHPFTRPAAEPDAAAADETYWREVAKNYRVETGVTNLEGGYWGIMALPVLAEFERQTERVNSQNSVYARTMFPADAYAARERAAAALGADVSEVAFTRGATEALQCLIGGYNRLRRGDVVLYADLDYPAMQYAMNWLVDRRGVEVARLTIPEPATHDSVIAAYARALDANPRARLLLLTHVNNKTGLVLPVKAISALARERGADVIVDAAHSWGQLDISPEAIGADFIGFNLHKWIGAPVGVGLMYIRKDRLGDVDRMMADEDNPPDRITSRVHTGTMNFATVLTVPAALAFHAAVGPAHKAARVRYLRDRWVKAVRGVSGIDVLTPDEPGMAGAITSFRLHGRTGREDNLKIVETLKTEYRLFTTRRNGIAGGDCVRVTPTLYNLPDDVDRLAGALTEMAGRA